MSFADDYFNRGDAVLKGEPMIDIEGESCKPYRDGDRVYVDHGDVRFRVVAYHGDGWRGIVELREAPRL